ncbi:hypothetical protein [Mycobacterium sp. OTB74]|uniref:PaaI family thioesterase n=1 Tax=Mycobacterium sp. OTB74 TaxID=1853452 RepID=UPI00247531D2|nr:hypothetical protein [Mycobacterium sp. OTB74]MDH6242791.1 hypothetical protein [Mycobacterium sp. OTB74]
MSDAPRFGEKPLAQTVAAAAAMRRLTGLLMVQEHDHPAVTEMLAGFARWEAQLAATAPADPAPRIGDRPDDDRRLYLDHAFDVGSYNACFPEYRFDRIDGDTASGEVNFPLAYEGPPGLVHGGFLGVFFDCVIQQHNCATCLSGKTRSLQVKYRRPTPLLTDLRFEIVRTEGERGLTSTARLLDGDEVLVIGTAETVALPPENLTGSNFGLRRPTDEEKQL